MTDDDRIYIGPADHPNQYWLGNQVGSGGEGSVFEAWEMVENTPKRVAVKLLHRSDKDPDFDRRVAEARSQLALVQSIEHPSIVRMRTAFVGAPPHRAGNSRKAGRCLYLVMNWAEGTPLSSWTIARPKRSWPDVVKILEAVSAALAHLHSGVDTNGQAIIHRDMKPSNVIVDDDGQVKIVDFGLARGASRLPAPGRTAGYAAPETSNGSFSIASDVYSLSAVAYFLLVGANPPDAADPEVQRTGPAAFRAGLTTSELLRHQPRVIDHLLSGLSRNPTDRPPSVREWLVGFTSAASTSAVRGGPLPPPAPDMVPVGRHGDSPPIGRNRALAGAVAVVALTIAAAVFAVNRDSRGGPEALATGQGVTETTGGPATTTTLPPTTTSTTTRTTSTSTLPPPVTNQPAPVLLSALEPVEGSVTVEEASISGDPFYKAVTAKVGRCGSTESTVQYHLSRDYRTLQGTLGLEDSSFFNLVIRVDMSTDGPNPRSQTWTVRHGEAYALDLGLSDALRLKIVVTVISKGPYSENSCTLGKWALGEAKLVP